MRFHARKAPGGAIPPAAIYGRPEYVPDGGLLAFGVYGPEVQRRVAVIVDKILKGADPSDLPVEQPTRFEIVINVAAACRLGWAFPASILLRAVIE